MAAVLLGSLGANAVAQDEEYPLRATTDMGTAPDNLALYPLLQDLVTTHDRVKAAEASLESARSLYDSSRAQWYPRLDMTAEGGYEEVDKPGEAATQMIRNEETLTATQLLYDFGGADGSIALYEGVVGELTSVLEQTRQSIIFQGITSYLMVIRSREMLRYAVKSEESVMRLSGMQEALVRRGAGLSYEELQVKGQLAGTQAYRVSVERELQNARNNFRSVFGFALSDEEVEQLAVPAIPVDMLPENLDIAIDTALVQNPFVTELEFTMARQRGDLESKESAFYPRFDLVGEAVRKEEDQGTQGVRTEGRATLQMTYNLFAGGADADTVSAVRSDIVATRRSLQDRRRTVEENVRNAWIDYITLQQNVELYQNQANITWEFLSLIKKKKATGAEVNLLDILVGERDYISAISSKVTADVDTIIAAYNLLFQMGQITVDVVGQ